MFPINSKNSFSERVDIPNCLAFSSFDPEFSPATRYVVVFVIEFFVCPPALSTIVLALFLFIRFNEPVNTNISPSKELEEDFFICSITTPLSMQLFTMVKLFLSFQNSTMDFATILPISFISNSSLSSAIINVSRSLLYFFSNNFAVCSPTFLIPKAYLANVVYLDLLIESIILVADLSPKPSRLEILFFLIE